MYFFRLRELCTFSQRPWLPRDQTFQREWGLPVGFRRVVNNNSSSNRIHLRFTQKGAVVGEDFTF
jgi:hypothetical protein